MLSKSKSNPSKKSSQLLSFLPPTPRNDDDDFQTPLPRPLSLISSANPKKLLEPSSSSNITKPQSRPPPNKKPKSSPSLYHSPYPGKENIDPNIHTTPRFVQEELELEGICSLDMIESSFDSTGVIADFKQDVDNGCPKSGCQLGAHPGYLRNSIEVRLMKSTTRVEGKAGVSPGQLSLDEAEEEFEGSSELDALIKLCSEETGGNDGDCSIKCPICGNDISGVCEEARLVHTNECLDKEENQMQDIGVPGDEREPQVLPEVVDGPDRSLGKVAVVAHASPVVDWLRNLGLGRYEEAFIREEVDWDTLQWLTEEDLFSIGVSALGPRKKIMHALNDLRKGHNLAVDAKRDSCVAKDLLHEFGSRNSHGAEMQAEASKVIDDETSKPSVNKLITDYFSGSLTERKKVGSIIPRKHQGIEKCQQGSVKTSVAKTRAKGGKLKDIPLWCSIPGTPFRVDAFKYLRGDCSHWFLSHFHMDHYQGLTRSFCHGKIYCSSITARLVNTKIGIPWDRLQILPLNQKINIAGVDVTCLDANHCPGAIIILFEPSNGKAVLHTGDFRFCERMKSITILQTCPIHTLILDTTYCNPQFDFPKQEAVIQFVIEAIQAEAFNPKTLFLIGSYTIGKERLFLEVARVLHRKVHVNAAKFRLLECLGFSEEDMQWFTLNEQESHIHVVPMWTLASFKRLKHVSNQYAGRFSLIVAFSPTGWTFGKGKKKSPGRRWQQGTIIRYEVPYSEHCSFSELKEFVKFVSPEKVIPSVNNDGPDSADAMVSLLLS